MMTDFCEAVRTDCIMDGKGSKSPSPALEESASRHNSRESDSGSHVEKRRKHRRGRKRHNKPYHLLTSEEREKLVERAQEKQQKRQQLFAKLRRPVAPENTTQFLIEDREFTAPRLPSPSRVPTVSAVKRSTHSFGSSAGEDEDDYTYESPEDEVLENELFLVKDFANTYREHHMERLHSMGKEELMDEYLTLEKSYSTMEENLQNSENRISSLEHEVQLLQQHCDSNTSSS